MMVGYARTSTAEQPAGFEAQIRDLEAAGCEKVFSEHTSAMGRRPELERAIDYIRDTDQLVVTRLDRFARSVTNAIELEQRISAKGATLKILAMNIDTSCATGRLTFNVLVSVAQFERELLLERQREGIARAKAEGKYQGRKPTVRAQAAEIERLKGEGLSNAEIARRLNVHRSNVGRVLSGKASRKSAKQEMAA